MSQLERALRHIKCQPMIEDTEENMKMLKRMEEEFYGPQLIRKDADAAVATPAYSTLPDWVQPVFGRRLWSFMNYEKNVLAVLPKAKWQYSGWRMLTTPALDWSTHNATERTGGQSRGFNLPDTVKVTPVVNATQPKEIMHTWGVLEIDNFLSSIDDSIQIIPEMRAELGKEHAALINTMLVQGVESIAAAANKDWAGTNNIESLRRIISSDAEEDAIGGTYHNMFDPWVNYGLNPVDRDSGTTYDSQVVSFGSSIGTDGDITLPKIEQLWRQIQEAGGQTDVIITGADFVAALSEILEPERRFMGEMQVYPTYGGVRGLSPGVDAAFSVSSFRGIPIITTRVMRDTTTDTISPSLWLDTQYLELRTASPTRYMETSRTYDAYVAQNKMRIEGAYYTAAELICYRFNTQGKLRDAK